MIIIAGHLTMAETDRDRFVDAHRDLVERARASDGCIHLAITADSVDPRGVNNVEVWTDSDALEAWRARANAPHTGIAIEDQAMARYEAVDWWTIVSLT